MPKTRHFAKEIILADGNTRNGLSNGQRLGPVVVPVECKLGSRVGPPAEPSLDRALQLGKGGFLFVDELPVICFELFPQLRDRVLEIDPAPHRPFEKLAEGSLAALLLLS